MIHKIKKSSVRIKIRDVCFIAVFTAIIAVCAQLGIPAIGGVPFTLQTFAIPLAGIILGAKRGAVSAAVYVLLGVTGVPVFSGFRGGFGVVFGATGGFILTFPLFALCAGIFSDISANKNPPLRYFLVAAGVIFGAAINYLGGMLMFNIITSRSLYEAFVVCVLPYVPLDIIKFILAGGIGVSVKKILAKNKFLT